MTQNAPLHFLAFADRSGLDLPRFNTLRLGMGWAKKLRQGDMVLLAWKDQIVGACWVEEIHTGPKEEIVARFAAGNHVELAAAASPGHDPEGAAARRLASMRANYGPRSFDKTKSATALVLVRRT